jgi:hypothetical protein
MKRAQPCGTELTQSNEPLTRPERERERERKREREKEREVLLTVKK